MNTLLKVVIELTEQLFLDRLGKEVLFPFANWSDTFSYVVQAG